ncbi:hypothetical protein HYH02_014405 [Chlamydomonas schloesseri]|uniref:Uncharacterized protein n=1 Tax=Chlamydomonas schloesseri TaxID=2026947 RepID=A0A835SU88_9CHLO|nr:hypothetical protein HYH02_014405 [Chlamydomonas schloesseri]|eukprot:KAG2428389.1 hypothetical protein HYH02_014405 [Chlamydomonas schloesseri]
MPETKEITEVSADSVHGWTPSSAEGDTGALPEVQQTPKEPAEKPASSAPAKKPPIYKWGNNRCSAEHYAPRLKNAQAQRRAPYWEKFSVLVEGLFVWLVCSLCGKRLGASNP